VAGAVVGVGVFLCFLMLVGMFEPASGGSYFILWFCIFW
jgi:hypothetical protein